MSRNMIEANRYIFKVLASFVKESNIDVPIFEECKRCIKTDETEKQWLKELKIITKCPILPKFKTASFEFDDKQYFVVIGWETHSEIEQEVLEEVEPNAGMITALLYELKVPIHQKSDPYEIVDEIFYQPEEELTKYEFAQVVKFFEKLLVYRIQDESPFIERVQDESPFENQAYINHIKLSGFYIIKNPQITSLNFSKETINSFEKLFLEGSNNVPYENFLFSLVSIYWKYSFLDIYRCIEKLFCVSILETLHKKLQIKDSLVKFSADVETYIGWRPKENEAINKLIDNSPDEALKLLKEIKSFIDGNSEGKYGELVYRIRNSIVHFRPATEQIELKDEHWDKLIRASLLVIECWYDKYDKQLSM